MLTPFSYQPNVVFQTEIFWSNRIHIVNLVVFILLICYFVLLWILIYVLQPVNFFYLIKGETCPIHNSTISLISDYIEFSSLINDYIEFSSLISDYIEFSSLTRNCVLPKESYFRGVHIFYTAVYCLWAEK